MHPWLMQRGLNQWIFPGDVTLLSTKLITKEGHEALKKELDYLWREKRPDTTRKVTWAASLGDRSENADYQYNKKLLREIDRRVRYLRKRLEDMRVVEYMPEQEGKVFFGAWVDIENEQGETKRFRIVGYDEIYERMDYISIDSPMARALLRKEVDDEAIVQTPNGEMCWWITGIEYIKYCEWPAPQGGSGPFLFQPSRSTASGLAFNARRVPNTPAPPISTAPITGSTSSHG